MSDTPVDQTQDEKLSPGAANWKNLCALGNVLLAILAVVALVVSIVAYTQGSTKKPEEAAQCVVIGLFVPFIICAYLIMTLKYNSQALGRLLFVGFIITLYGLCSLGFGVVFARRLINDEDWQGEVTVRTSATVINLVNVYGHMLGILRDFC
ncbi:hypothetical protein ACJ41O_005728 [Fusarium nematophilum]